MWVILTRCNNKTLDALLHIMETLRFLKIKIEENKGVWDSFFLLWVFFNLKLKKPKEFGISFLHMKLWVF